MRLVELTSRRNLELAWRRITTGGNHQYKRLYRGIYYAYEVALDRNLADLQQRLRGGTFQPHHPERVYIPKASGLHRPIALLNIEDQIVLQAFANLAAVRIQKRRAPLQFRVVFSNILQKPNSIFFFRQWQRTYSAFQERITKHYSSGRRWVGDFDLAAFYDTIPHELLLKTVYPRTGSTDLTWFGDCLRVWSSNSAASCHRHGLPQGPLASDFLAECFMLPVDLELRDCKGYVRYVDDVRLFGSTEDEVRADLIKLERHCRERGLIPQVGKFAIKHAQSIRDAMGMLPSISDPQHESGTDVLDATSALATFRRAIDGRPLKVTDKTRARYVLYRAEPSSELLSLVLRLVPHHPEHTDALFAYLGRFGYRKPIERLCMSLIVTNPYPYVRGEAWHVLARYLPESKSVASGSVKVLINRAIGIAKVKTRENLAERWGACHFLCVAEDLTTKHYSRFLKGQAPLLQALVAPILPASAFGNNEVVAYYLRQATPEPGLSVCSSLSALNVSMAALGISPADLQPQVANTLRELGIISSPHVQVDAIGEILEARYRVPKGKSWRAFLGARFTHALGLLKQAEAAFSMAPSFWLPCQNSFNQTIFLALQDRLHAANHSAACTTRDKNGSLVDFGVTLDAGGPFSKNCPTIGDCFRNMNARRNRLPVSHPYEKKTSQKTQYFTAKERRLLLIDLRKAYLAFIAMMP